MRKVNRAVKIFRRFFTDDGGNVSVVTALCIMAIVFFAALAIDLGFLTMEKDHLQNKTEAAVESGIHVLHSDSTYLQPFYKIRESFLDNGENLPLMLLYLRYHPGFYDYRDEFGDFGHFKNFASMRYGEVPAGVIPNAVAVIDLKKNIDTIEMKPGGTTTGRVGVSAVAYSKNYTFLALDDSSDAMTWCSSFNVNRSFEFENCLIGCNGDLHLYDDVTYTNTTIEAVGNVSIYSGNSPPEYNEVKEIKVSSIDWDALRAQAEANGKVYSWAEINSWPEYTGSTTVYGSDDYASFCRRLNTASGELNVVFIPNGDVYDSADGTNGDHGGRTYFFDVPEPSSVGLNHIIIYFQNAGVVDGPDRRRFWNCTIAAPCDMNTFPGLAAVYGRGLWFGNYDPDDPDDADLVYLYCEDFGRSYTNHSWYMAYGGWGVSGGPQAIPSGVVVRSNNMFYLNNTHAVYGQQVNTFYLKVIARKINVRHSRAAPQTVRFVGGFGKPDVFRLGSLHESKQ